MALKDLIDQAGLPTTCGSSFYRRIPEISAISATLVRRLESAGAIIHGRAWPARACRTATPATENSRTGTNLQALKVMLKEGCATSATCVSDRRLAQWCSDPAVFPDQTQNYEDHQRMAYRRTFYERLLPARGRLVSLWNHIPNDSYDRAFTREEPLGDTSQRGFGKPTADWADVLLFTSIWKPWANEVEVYHFPWWETHYRPVAQAWVIGLAGTDTAPATKLVGAEYAFITDDLFKPYNPQAPLEGGLGLSYKEVACEWLRGYEPSGYWYDGKWCHPCHFSFYDPAAATATLVNNTARWLIADRNTVATYNANAIAWFVPDRREVIDGRSIYDPDIFSWQIPRLEYGSCGTGVAQWPRSTTTGAAVPAYFANLTKESVTIRRVNPDGTRTLLATLPTWTGLAHPAAGSGAIPYSSTTPAMVRLDSHVGAAYVVQTLGGTCVGTYLVGEPPANAVAYQVAEIHSHGDGVGGILDH